MIHFGEMDEHGNITNERDIDISDIRKCPHLIMVPEHYRADGSCRCDDPFHSEMKEWEYTWDSEKGMWT